MPKLGRTIPALLISAAAIATGCGEDGGSGGPSGGSGGQVSMVMSWLPEAEQGGYWQTQAAGGKADGPKITVKPGGPQIEVIPQVASGQFDYGLADADEVLQARSQGVPIVAVFSTFETSLRCFMSQPAAGIESIRDIDGNPVAIASGSGFWEYVKKEFDLDVKEQNYTGTLAQLKNNDQLVQQCYVTSEPYVAKQQSIPFNTLLVAESGYNPYTATLFTTEENIERNPEQVKQVIAAVADGWKRFVADPAPAFDRIEKLNEEVTRPELQFAYDQMRKMLADPMGCMDPQRWEKLAEQMKGLDLIKGDVNPSQAFTNEFVPVKCRAGGT